MNPGEKLIWIRLRQKMIINKIMAADTRIEYNTIVGVLTNNTNDQYIQQTIGGDTNGGEREK